MGDVLLPLLATLGDDDVESLTAVSTHTHTHSSARALSLTAPPLAVSPTHHQLVDACVTTLHTVTDAGGGSSADFQRLVTVASIYPLVRGYTAACVAECACH